MALNITRGVVPKAQKVVVYGPEGIGKTTLASQFPDPLFLDVEGGSSHLDVARAEQPRSWSALLQAVDEVRAERPCRTLVVDTADWAERLCMEHLCAKNRWESIETPGYGKGYTALMEEFGRFLDKLTDVAGAGVGVVLTAHAAMRKFEQPDEAAAYDRWELKLQKKTAPLVKEWADAVLFVNYKTIVETVGDGASAKGKARGGRRVIYASHHACWDAKNRWGMPDESPLAWESVAPYLPELPPPAPQAPPAPPAPASQATKNVAKAAPQQKTLPEERPVAGPGQTVTFGAGGATVAPTAPASPAEGLPAYWDPLLQLMEPDGITPQEVLGVAARLKHFTPETTLAALPQEYIEGFAVGNWEKFRQHVMDMRADSEPVPFD